MRELAGARLDLRQSAVKRTLAEKVRDGVPSSLAICFVGYRRAMHPSGQPERRHRNLNRLGSANPKMQVRADGQFIPRCFRSATPTDAGRSDL
jgi:hypothetical protein